MLERAATVRAADPATGCPVDDGAAISPAVAMAPFVVAAIALSFAAYPLGGKAVIAAFLSAVLVVIAAIDLERRIVPNRIVLPATVVVLIARIALSPGHADEYVLASLLAAAGMLLPRVISRSAVGMGDVKLALLIGAGLGWGVAWAIVVASLCVFPIAIAMMLRGGAAARRATIPMAPFLAVGALTVLLGPGLFGL